MLKKNERVTIEIEDISRNGEGIGKADGFALFVKDTVPGDLAEVSVMKLKKTYGYARLVRVVSPSPDRTEAPCPLAVPCGGCQLQAMSYEKQLVLKEKTVRDALERIGGIPDDILAGVMKDIVPSDPYLRYRNKAIYPIGYNKDGNPVAGFYAAHSHRIIPCADCLLGPKENRKILETILHWMKVHQIPAYDESEKRGLLRHVFLRRSRLEGRYQLCLIVNGDTIPYWKELREQLDSLKTESGESLIKGAAYSVNTKDTNVIFGSVVKTLWGDPDLTDSLHAEKYGISVQYRISPASFYQINPGIAEKMYEEVLELAGLTGNETVFDLYCGTGTISLFLAAGAQRVIGVEVVPEAVRNARENARLNQIENAEFLEGKAEEIVPELLRAEGVRADVVVVDPPRKGCDETLLKTIVSISPEKLIYASCDPATLARDLKYLIAEGYRLQSIRPYDQFAMSMHIESCVLLERVSNRKADSYVKLNVKMEDYYRIKDAEGGEADG